MKKDQRNQFFKEVKKIKSKYWKEKDERDFNIFSVLKSEGDEVNLHSRFIYELLNPIGTHHRGTEFLNLFLKELRITKLELPVAGRVKVKKEYPCIVSRVDGHEKSYLDILISFGSTAIILENKIYSEPTVEQIEKYHRNIQKQGFQRVFVVLLSLFEEEGFMENLNLNGKNITYETHIKRWLKKCSEITSPGPLKECIEMYLSLVLKLTKQDFEEGMIKEMKELLLKDKDNLIMGVLVEQTMKEVKIKLQKMFWENLEKSLEDSINNNFKNTHLEISKNNKWNEEKIKKSIESNENQFGLCIPLLKKNSYNLVCEIVFWNFIYYRFLLYDKNYEKKLGTKDDNNDENKKRREDYGKILIGADPGLKDSGFTYWKEFEEGSFYFNEFSSSSSEILDLLDEEKGQQIIGSMTEKLEEVFRRVLDSI